MVERAYMSDEPNDRVLSGEFSLSDALNFERLFLAAKGGESSRSFFHELRKRTEESPFA
jgi:hypothetical protein